MTKPRIIACPICAKTVRIEPRDEHFPFCSLICKNIDLGRWMDQRYAVDMRTGKLSLIDEEELEESLDDDQDEHSYH